MSFTFVVSNELKSKLVNLEHSLNIYAIDVTLDVLKFDKFKLVKLEQPSNILLICFTFEVSKFDKSKLVSDLQFLNIPP